MGRDFGPGDEVVVTDLDHDANIAPWAALAEGGVTIRRVPVRPRPPHARAYSRRAAQRKARPAHRRR